MVVSGFLFSAGLFLVGADLDVDCLHIADIGLQLLRRFIQKIQSITARNFTVATNGFILRLQVIQLPAQAVSLSLHLRGPLPLPLVLAVPGKDVLLPLNQVIGGNRLHWGLRVSGDLFGVLGFLVGNPANRQTVVVKGVLFPLQLYELILYTDNFQQDSGLFLRTCLHEFRQIERELFHKFIEQLLAGTPPFRVRDL